MKRTIPCALAAAGLLLSLTVGCGDSCFEESTLVRTPEGLVAIGELQVGDAVLSIDPSTGIEATTHVARVFHAWAWCERLVVGGQSVWLTEEHPLYSPELSGFQPAESWLNGELAQTLSAEGDQRVAKGGGWLDQKPCRVVDLTVDAEPHTFVAAGIVAHNKEVVCLPGGCPEGYVCRDDSCVPEGGSGGSGGGSGQGGAAGLGGAGGG